MTAPTCPQCGQVIPSDDINVAKDVAYCRRCNAGRSLSALLGLSEDGDPVDLQRPPAGAWCRTELSGMVIGATHRSWGKALGLLAISLFWNGIVSVFVLLALSGTVKLVAGSIPAWFPAPKMNGSEMGVGMVIFLWLFLTPFITIGAVMLISFVSTLGGRTEVRVSKDAGSVYVGVGRLGWTRRFDPAQVKRIELAPSAWRNSEGDPRSQLEIRLEEKGGRVLKFGSLLSEERREFVLGALRQIVS